MAVLGLCFCARAFSGCGKRGPLFTAVRGPLTIAASLVAEHRLQMRRLSSCGSRAQLLHGMWDPPGPGLEPVSPALAGRFSTTAPPGKPPAASLLSWAAPSGRGWHVLLVTGGSWKAGFRPWLGTLEQHPGPTAVGGTGLRAWGRVALHGATGGKSSGRQCPRSVSARRVVTVQAGHEGGEAVVPR